ncbi:MAG TPA: DinB family protein [Anaerolineaceae bacterium]|nr:DinB family protein [Anaerolineaceae bacterium]
MSESEHLAEALTRLLFEEENGWFLPAYQALEGLSAEQAARSPGEKFNSPWAIVRHMTYWMEFIQLRLRGEEPKPILGEDWLPLPDPASESAWAADKQRLKEVTLQLAETVRAWDDSLLEEPFSKSGHNRRQVIQGVIGHNCYHTNELICSRHMLGYWLEQT